MTLDNVELNHTAKVVSMNCNKSLKQRLNDLGLINGTLISPMLCSPLNNPRAYEFRRNIIAIRNEDAKNIIVK